MKSVKDKLIITAAVGFTAASTMVNPHFTNVLAEEIKDPAFVKEDASKTKTEKEKLEDSVKDAKSNLDEKKADVDAKKELVDASQKSVDELMDQKTNQQSLVDGKLNAEEDVYNNLAKKISDLEKEIENKKAELKDQEDQQAVAKDTLDKAKQALQDKEKECDVLKAELSKYDEKDLKDKLDSAQQGVNQAKKDYENTETLKNETLSLLEAVNKNVEAKKKELDDAKAVYQTAVNDVAAKQAAVDKAQADVDSFNQSDALDTAKSDLAKAQTNLEKAKAEEALNNAKKDLEVSKQAEKDAQTLVNQKQNAYEMVLKDKGTVEDNLNSVNNSLAAAQKALDDANTNYQVASQKVAEFNTKQDELNNLKDEIEAQNSLVERYVQDEKDAQAVVKETKEKIVALTKDKDNTENQKEGQGKVLAFMRRVREQGSNADLSDVDDSELVLYLSQYAREVDELNRIEQDLATANARYFRILEEYENAKQAQDEAQAEYESAMKKLDTYIKASAKHAKKDEEKKNEATTTNKTNTGKVNTGVETQFVTNAALMGVAALGIVEAKKRSKK